MYILASYARGLNFEDDRLPDTPAGLEIGIADSARAPPAGADVETANGADYHTDQPRDPIGHGTAVFELVSSYVSEATYRFYRTIGSRDSDDRRLSELVQGIYSAWCDGVDVLNVSGGASVAYDSEAVSGYEVDKFVRNGLLIVSACGNYLKDHTTSITFPANHPETIGVAGYDPLCSCTDDVDLAESYPARYAFTPDPVSDRDALPSRMFCGYTNHSQGKCTTSDACTLTESCWNGNVPAGPDDPASKPDIYAPVRYPALEDGLTQKVGTSYAAPIITACLVTVLDPLHQQDVYPSPLELRKKLSETGVVLMDGDGHKPDGASLYESLSATDPEVPSL